MPGPMVDPAALLPDPEVAPLVRAALEQAGYTGAGIAALTGADASTLAGPHTRDAYIALTARLGGPLAGLVRLFVLHDDVPVGTVDGDLLGLLERAGFVAVGSVVTPLVALLPLGALLVAFDRGDVDSPDVVAGVHGPSRALADLTLRTPVARALDVGTGNGIQAVLLAQHAEHVVATDLSERALGFTRVTCLLNDVDNVELRAGSLLEPVRGEQFDLVAINPPYLIAPSEAEIFRSNQDVGDALCARLCAELPSVLRPGGVATVMLSWVERDDAAPLNWFIEDAADVLVLHGRTEPVMTTVTTWTRDTAGQPGHRERVSRWLDHYAEHGITHISYGAAVVRKPAEPRPTASLLIPLGSEVSRPATDQIAHALEAIEILTAAEDPLALPISLDAGAVLTQSRRPGPGRWFPMAAEIASDIDMPFALVLGPAQVALVDALATGAPTMGAAVAATGADRETARELLLDLLVRAHATLA